MRDSIIIEHPTKGVLNEWDGFGDDRSFHWSWSGRRDDSNKSHQFRSLDDAVLILNQIPERIRQDCRIMKRDAGEIEYKAVG